KGTRPRCRQHVCSHPAWLLLQAKDLIETTQRLIRASKGSCATQEDGVARRNGRIGHRISGSARRLASGTLAGAWLASAAFASPVTSEPAARADSAQRSALDMAPVAPNPVRTVARITYRLEHASSVRVTILDARGQTVATVENGYRSAGTHVTQW